MSTKKGRLPHQWGGGEDMKESDIEASLPLFEGGGKDDEKIEKTKSWAWHSGSGVDISF